MVDNDKRLRSGTEEPAVVSEILAVRLENSQQRYETFA